jgi:hypothetical protein
MSDTAIHLDVRSRREGSVYETGPSTFLCAPLRDVPYTEPFTPADFFAAVPRSPGAGATDLPGQKKTDCGGQPMSDLGGQKTSVLAVR